MDKPWYKSVTIVSALVFSVLQTLEQQGVFPAGAAQSVVQLIQNAIVVLGAFGLRKAIG